MSFSRIITNDIFLFDVLDFPSLDFLHSRKKLMLKKEKGRRISPPLKLLVNNFCSLDTSSEISF